MGCNMRREKSESPEGEEGKGEIKKYIHTYIYIEREEGIDALERSSCT